MCERWNKRHRCDQDRCCLGVDDFRGRCREAQGCIVEDEGGHLSTIRGFPPHVGREGLGEPGSLVHLIHVFGHG